MLDDEQHVERVGRLLAGVDALAGLSLEFVDLLVASHIRRRPRPMVCSSRICAWLDRSGTITQMLLTSKPSRSMSTLTITFGCSCRSISNSRSRAASQSSLLISPLRLESTAKMSSSLSPVVSQEFDHKGRNVGFFAHDQHLRMLVRVGISEARLQLAQLLQPGAQHDALPLDRPTTRFCSPLGPELQRQRGHFLALVQRQ